MPAPAIPLPSPCTCFRLRRAARQVSQMYDRELSVVDLSLNEYSILRRVAPSPRSLGELADLAGMDRSTLNRNLKPLLDAGWLKEARGPDARQRLIAITSSGRARIAKAMPCWQRAQTRLESLYGVAETQRLNADLDALERAVRPGEAVR